MDDSRAKLESECYEQMRRNDAIYSRLMRLSGPNDPKYPDIWWELHDGVMRFEQLVRRFERLA